MKNKKHGNADSSVHLPQYNVVRLQIVFVAMASLLIVELWMLQTAIAQTDEPATTSSDQTSSLKNFRTYPLLDQANRALAAGDIDKARRFLDRAIRIDDTDPDLWIALGNVELRAESPAKAIKYFDNALALDNSSARSYLYRGLGRLATGDNEAGLLDIGQSLQSDSLSIEDKALAQQTVSNLGFTSDFLLQQAVPDRFAQLRDEIQSVSDAEAYRLLSETPNLPAELRLTRASLASRIGRHKDSLHDIDILLSNEMLSSEQYVATQRLAIEVRNALDDEVGVVDAYRALLSEDALSSTQLSHATTSARRVDNLEAVGLFLTARLRFATGAERHAILAELADVDIAENKLDQAASRLRELAYDRTALNAERAQAWRRMGELSDGKGDELESWIAYRRAFELSKSYSDAALVKSKASSEPVVNYLASQIVSDTPLASDQQRTSAAGSRSKLVVSERMRALMANEDCQDVLADLQNKALLAAEPSRLFNMAECLQKIDYNIAADRIFRRALDHSDTLSTEQLVYAWSSIAFLSEERGDFTVAQIAWNEVANVDEDIIARINAARTGRLAGRAETARGQLARIDPESLVDSTERTAYFNELSLLLEPEQPTDAIAAIERSLATPDSANRHRRAAAIALRVPDSKLAIMHLNYALMLEPNDIDTRLQLGYEYIEQDSIDEALHTFETLTEMRPDDADILLQYAYLQKQQKEFKKAADSYRTYIDLRTRQADPSERESLSHELLNIRSEVRSLEKRVFVYGVLASEDASGSGAGSVGHTDVSDSPAELEAGWSPAAFERSTGTRLTAFTRFSGTMNDEWGELDDGSSQAALGLRWQPMPAVGLFLQGQRRIGLDAGSSDSWVLTGAYSWSSDFSVLRSKSGGNRTSLYSDMSLTFSDVDAKSGFIEIQQGRGFSLMPGATVTPHLVTTGRAYDDEFGFKGYVDGGVGVSARLSFGADTYRAFGGYVDLTLQYRRTLVNDYSDDNEKLAARFTFGY